MPVPTHGPNCRSLTYPLICRYCGKKIFYFTCNHGSKVFFENLGWPWRIHDCQSPENIIAEVAFTIEEDYIRLITENARLRREREDRLPITAYRPRDGEVVRELGIVREIIDNINVFKKFKIDAGSPMAAAFIGSLANHPHVQVTIHAGDLTQQLHSYTFLLKKRDWDRYGPIRGDLLDFTLEGRQLPTGDLYWYCTEIEQL